MFGTRSVVYGSLACMLAFTATSAQTATSAETPHTITITLIERPGTPKPYGFDPATFTAQRGDTLRFVQGVSVLHNVHFKSQPKGAKLGSAAMSPYLTTKGQAYVLVVDSRFTDGTYEIVCDPHETIGMHAFLTVKNAGGHE